MNQYLFKEIKVGQKESFTKTITEKDMQSFMEITKDTNPLHNNTGYAIEHGFKDRVVYGMLSSSLISTLGGVYLPGKYCLILSVRVDFKKPAFIGDEMAVEGTVISKKDFAKLVEIGVTIINQNKDLICSGTLLVKVMK